MQHVNLLLVDIYIFFPIGNGVAGIGTKWVFTHKNPTIQLVGPVLKQYALLATRASEARFTGPKSSL